MKHRKTGTPRKKAVRKKQKTKLRDRKSASNSATLDPRANERTMFQLRRLVEERDFQSAEEAKSFLHQIIGASLPVPTGPSTLLDTAQEKMYEAWGATGRRRIDLARQALDISPMCADAYVLLAEETADSPEDALKLYELGMKMGARALGEKFFEENTGDFWGILETRPYMRAREGVARTLDAMGHAEQAIGHYREMLRLNPNDNQGNRYALLSLLLREGLNKEAEKLLDDYDEEMAEWLYARALLEYRSGGASSKAAAALRRAFDENPWVPAYTTGLKKPPKRLPDRIGVGDSSEALHYLNDHGDAWLSTPGALQWLAETFIEFVGEFENGQG